MLERKLIAAALQSRDAFSTILASGVAEGFDETVRPIWDGIVRYYERDENARTGDADLIGAEIGRGISSPKRRAETQALVAELGAEPVSLSNVTEYVSATAVGRAGDALAAAIAGRKPPEDVARALRAFTEAREGLVEAPEALPADQWTGALRSRLDGSSRYVVSPRVLNQHISGGVAPGHNVTIFGRPESGKTALAITMACGFARRGLGVLYIGNEDPVQDLMVRMITNLTNKTVDELALDPDAGEREALAAGARFIVVKATAPGTIAEIESLVKRHKPAVLFVDQLRNITSGKSDNYTQLLDKNAQAVRALGKRYGLVTVSVTQAGDSASGRPVLDMGDVDSSNTGIPGAADLMIGVGVTEALDSAGQRMLSLCKNKLGVVKPAIPVSLDPYRSKMK